jgi:hypothetical protein
MAKTYQFIVYRRLSIAIAQFTNKDMKMCDLVEAPDYGIAIRRHGKNAGYSPQWTQKKDRPRRNYYYCDGWELCIRSATTNEIEQYRLMKRFEYYNDLAGSWDIATCKVVGTLAIAAGVAPLVVSDIDLWLARKTAAQLAFNFTRLTGGPIVPNGPETKKTGVFDNVYSLI